MTEPRELRSLVLVEVAAVLAIAVVPWPDRVPVALPLVVAATVARWVRGRSWSELWHGRGHAKVGALVGLGGFAVALAVMTPLAGGMVQWSEHAIVRGNASALWMVALLVAVTAAAEEAALRGWLVERALELRAPPLVAVLLGAAAEAIVMPGDLTNRLGAAVFGLGLGWIYVAGKRSLVAPVTARVVFVLALVAAEWLRLVD
ncbi:MAG TPA: CPBP family glutamic-type intramembrane protease [Kofleriaceae bacterium]|nr:CPBP family glutamic-type intramembrane protease [Kofleriaceae bacterium]